MESETNQKNNRRPERVAIYIRVSTQEQATEGYGLESQKRILENYVRANEDRCWATSDELFYSDEGVSGTTEVSERPALSRLREDVLAKKVDVVLVWKIDRLFRKTSLLLNFVEFLKKTRVNFVSKNENVDLDSPAGKLVLTLLGAIAEMERDVIAERTLEGKKSKSMQGYVVYGKFVPFGYQKVSDGRGSLLAIQPEEAEIVREIFRMYAYENKSSSEIARILTERGTGTNIDRKNSEGKSVRTKMYTGLFVQHSIMRILQNKAYIGTYISNKTRTVRSEQGKMVQVPKDESEWIISACERIVDDDVFHRVQELVKQGQVVHGHGKNGVHLFTGIAKCAECGRGFHYYRSKKGTGNYSCGGKKKSKVSAEHRCVNPDISEIKLMHFVWPQVEAFLENPGDLVRRYGSELASGEGKGREVKCRKDLAEIEKAIAKKKQELKTARIMEIRHPDESEIFSEISTELGNELHAFEKQRGTLVTDLEAYDRYEEHAKIVLEHSKAIRKRLKSVTDEEKAKLMRELLEGIYIGREEIVVKYKFERGGGERLPENIISYPETKGDKKYRTP